MKWQDLPARTSISMGKADVEKLRRSPAKAFVSGMVTGAMVLLFVQNYTHPEEIEKPEKPVAPISSSKN